MNQPKSTISQSLAGNLKYDIKSSVAVFLVALPENSTVEINASNSAYVDYDVVEVIADFRETAKARAAAEKQFGNW